MFIFVLLDCCALCSQVIAEPVSFDIDALRAQIGQDEILSSAFPGVSFTVTFAEPDARPVGIADDSIVGVLQSNASINNTDALEVKETEATDSLQTVQWISALSVAEDRLQELFEGPKVRLCDEGNGREIVNVRFLGKAGSSLAEVVVDVYYQTDAGYPAIRKWIEVTNNSPHWIKIEDLVLESSVPASAYQTRTDLTPTERGAGPSVIAFTNTDKSKGVIVASEIPSVLRDISPEGILGYNKEYFEWVLGPSESFVSEPVFHFSFSGDTYKTVSAISTALDRTIEGPFINCLENIIGISARPEDAPVPKWFPGIVFSASF